MTDMIHNIFKDLKSKEHVSGETFRVGELPFSQFHKIGISHDNEPMFFVMCNGNKKSILDISLDLISIMFNRSCKIYENGSSEENVYTVIKLNSDNVDIQCYFIDVVSLLLQQLPSIPSHKSLQNEIEKIIDLFRSLASIPKKTIQRLWAELLVIERAKFPELLIRAWHTSPEDKYDFNDGKDKIEVKSTTKIQRIHSFSIDQLRPTNGASLIIASSTTIQTGMGQSVLSLRNKILAKVNDIGVQLKLNEIIFKTLGTSIESATDMYFDYQTAVDSLRYYNCIDIPSIDKKIIPSNISNVRFDVDITSIEYINANDEFITSSQLFKALGI